MAEEQPSLLPNSMYLCPRAPFATVKIGTTKLQAKDGVLTLSSDLAAEFDKMIADPNRADIRHIFSKIDLAKAEKQVRDHQAARPKAAIAGTVTSAGAPEQAARGTNRNFALKTPEAQVISDAPAQPPIEVAEGDPKSMPDGTNLPMNPASVPKKV